MIEDLDELEGRLIKKVHNLGDYVVFEFEDGECAIIFPYSYNRYCDSCDEHALKPAYKWLVEEQELERLVFYNHMRDLPRGIVPQVDLIKTKVEDEKRKLAQEQCLRVEQQEREQLEKLLKKYGAPGAQNE